MKKIYSIFLFALVAIVTNAQNGPYLEPEGEATLCKIEREGFSVVWGEVAPDNQSAACNVIYGENNEVYFKMVPRAGHNGYVKGIKEGNKIKVELPQAVGVLFDELEEEETEVFIDALDYVEINGYQWYVNSGETSTLELEVAEDGSFSFNLKGEDDGYFAKKIIGLVGDLDPESQSWMGFGDWTETFIPNTQQPLALPEGLETETWRMFYEYDGRNVEVAIDGENIWLGNLCDELPDSYVKGTIDGDKVTFPITYMGYSEEAGNFVYFVPCYWEEFYFEQWDDTLEDYIIHDTWTFDYDAEAKKLSSIEEFSAIMIGTSDKVGEMAGSYIEMFFEPEIKWLDPTQADAPLQDPEFVYAYYDPTYECDFVEYFLPTMNQAGYPLDTEKMHYIFYIDGKPLTLTPDVYVGLEEEMTEIPFGFTDWNNQDIWAYDDQNYQICLYQEPASYSTVGLKIFYEKEDGTIIESNYVEADIEELSMGGIISGISDVNAKTVESVEYFDLQGRAIAKPSKGLSIKVKKFSDGSRTVVKSVE